MKGCMQWNPVYGWKEIRLYANTQMRKETLPNDFTSFSTVFQLYQGVDNEKLYVMEPRLQLERFSSICKCADASMRWRR